MEKLEIDDDQKKYDRCLVKSVAPQFSIYPILQYRHFARERGFALSTREKDESEEVSGLLRPLYLSGGLSMITWLAVGVLARTSVRLTLLKINWSHLRPAYTPPSRVQRFCALLSLMRHPNVGKTLFAVIYPLEGLSITQYFQAAEKYIRGNLIRASNFSQSLKP